MTGQEREALEAALEFIQTVERWKGSDPDEIHELIAQIEAALAAPDGEEMLRLPGTPSKSWRGGGTMGRRRSRMSELAARVDTERLACPQCSGPLDPRTLDALWTAHSRDDQRSIVEAALAAREDTGRPDGDSHWATVVIEPESFEPRELTEAESVELDESGLGIAVDRMWIRPGVRDTGRPEIRLDQVTEEER